MLGDSTRLGEQLVQHLRRRREMVRQLIEQVEELFIAWNQSTQHEAGFGERKV
jgi:hypothetical protein